MGYGENEWVMCVCCCKGLIVPMLWLAVLWQAGWSQAGRGNRETLYNTVLLIEIIWYCLILLHYLEGREKTEEKPGFLLCQLFL